MAEQTMLLKIPITMKDLNTGVERPATADEVRVGVDCDISSQTHWPDEGGDVAWWEEPGIVVFQKLRGTWINYGNFYFMITGRVYRIWIDYVYDTSYQLYRELQVNEDGSTYWVV